MTRKHQSTEERLKPTVRIFKNMRNRLIRDGKLKSGSAPSYFIEGLLYNVPTAQFAKSRQSTVENCWGWINTCNTHADLTCANGIHPLVRDNTHTSWSMQGYIDYLEMVRQLWQEWT